MRGVGFVRADKNAVGLLAQIGMRIGIAHHRQFHLEVDQLLERLGDHVVMQHVGDRYVVAGPGADDVAIGAGGIDHMLADDVALVGDDPPFARWKKLDVGDAGAAIDFGAELARAGRHRIGDVGGRDMAVGHGPEGGLDAEGFEEGMVLLDLAGADDLALVSGKLGNAEHIFEPVHLLIRLGDAQAAAAMPGDRLAGQFLELGIELGPVDMNLRHVERAVEMRALAGRMPGRARCQFALFDEDDIAPAFEGQMIKQADTHDAAPDHNHARMRFHRTDLSSGIALACT